MRVLILLLLLPHVTHRLLTRTRGGASNEKGKEGKIQGPCIGIDLGTTYSCVAVREVAGWLVEGGRGVSLACPSSFQAAFLLSILSLSLLSFHRFKDILIYIPFPFLSLQVWQNGRVEICPNDQGNRITPSYVSFTEDDQRLIGEVRLVL